MKNRDTVTAAERCHYINHIKRLQEQNRLLAEVIASERKARKEAYAWYFSRLQSKFWFIVDYMLWSQGSLRRKR